LSSALEDLRLKRVIVVGAGQAGLAMAHALVRDGLQPQVDFVLLDAAADGNGAWSRQWHSLRLLTPARHSSLPGFSFPGLKSRYPRADEVEDYLSEYANRLGLVPVYGTRVLSVRVDPHGHGLTLVTNLGEVATRHVVAATGPFAEPYLPGFANRARVPGQNIHSSDYTHPKQFPEGSVLIVGDGNSGRQLARELTSSHQVTLAMGAPRRESPQRFLGVDVFSWMRATGLLRIPVPAHIRRHPGRRETAIGQSLEELRTLGVRVVPRLVDATGSTFHLEDGSTIRTHSVLWATGYQPPFNWLPDQVRDHGGGIVQHRGATSVTGLYVLGLPWMRSRASSLLTGVGSDATHIARMIGRRP